MTEATIYTDKTASISEDECYRYRLTRSWGSPSWPRRTCTFVMLNPSTADAYEDDATIRRCVRFAKRFKCNTLKVVNLYALRSRYPTSLMLDPDPVGPMNAHYLRLAIDTATHCNWPIIVAWGASVDSLRDIPDQVGWFMQETMYQRAKLLCLGLTKYGEPRQPRHPLYVRQDAKLLSWPSGEELS